MTNPLSQSDPLTAPGTVRRFGLVVRRPDVSAEQFAWHWREVHGPLGVRNLPDTIRQYVQTPASHRPVPGFSPSVFDGTSEAWFASLDDSAALAQDPAMQPIRDDMPHFLSTTWMVTLIGQEHSELAHRRPGDGFQAKALLLLARSEELSAGDFVERWAALPAPAADGLLRHTRILVETGNGPLAYDGVAEYAFASFADLEAAFRAAAEAREPDTRASQLPMRAHLDGLDGLLDKQRTAAFSGYEIHMR